jgi:hypothetical protein
MFFQQNFLFCHLYVPLAQGATFILGPPDSAFFSGDIYSVDLLDKGLFNQEDVGTTYFLCLIANFFSVFVIFLGTSNFRGIWDFQLDSFSLPVQEFSDPCSSGGVTRLALADTGTSFLLFPEPIWSQIVDLITSIQSDCISFLNIGSSSLSFHALFLFDSLLRFLDERR